MIRTLDKVHLIVGSNNLTAGGLAFNYETALALELDTSKSEESKLVAEIEQYLAGC